MSSHVFIEFIIQVEEKINARLAEYFISFLQEFNKLNNTGA